MTARGPCADIAPNATAPYFSVMDAFDPHHRSLALADVRRELMLNLAELEAADPRPVWREERERGLSSGIDELFHFFFDDHDFGNADIGTLLFDESEVAAVNAVKEALDSVLKAVGDQDDDAFVEHPLWQQVTSAAAMTRRHLQMAS